LPMDPNYPEQRLAYMARDAEAAVLLTHQGLRRRLPHNNLSTQVCNVPYQAKQAA
jgi:non-ribosomal peptide synthetase component F